MSTETDMDMNTDTGHIYTRCSVLPIGTIWEADFEETTNCLQDNMYIKRWSDIIASKFQSKAIIPQLSPIIRRCQTIGSWLERDRKFAFGELRPLLLEGCPEILCWQRLIPEHGTPRGDSLRDISLPPPAASHGLKHAHRILLHFPNGLGKEINISSNGMPTKNRGKFRDLLDKPVQCDMSIVQKKLYVQILPFLQIKCRPSNISWLAKCFRKAGSTVKYRKLTV